MDLSKLNLTNYKIIVVRNKPNDIEMDISYENDDIRMDCLIYFVYNQSDVHQFVSYVKSLPQDERRQLYLLYPKQSSKKNIGEINRDIIIEEIKKDEKFFSPKLMSLDNDFSIFAFKYKR